MKKGTSNYDTMVEPRLKEIEQMALTMTEEQIAKAMGVGYRTFQKYKKEHDALSASLKKGRLSLVQDLHSTLIRRAKGFKYEERKQIIENGRVVREEVYTKSALPDVASIHLLLKNFDENWREDDKPTLDMKKERLAMEKARQENQEPEGESTIEQIAKEIMKKK